MKKILFILGSAFLPLVAFAQFLPTNNQPNFTYVNTAAAGIFNLLKYVMPVLMLLASAWFVWKVIEYIRAAPDKKPEARKHIISGVIGLAVIVSVWGIVALLQNIFGVNPASNVAPACPPGFRAVLNPSGGVQCLP